MTPSCSEGGRYADATVVGTGRVFALRRSLLRIGGQHAI